MKKKIKLQKNRQNHIISEGNNKDQIKKSINRSSKHKKIKSKKKNKRNLEKVIWNLDESQETLNIITVTNQ